MATSLTHLLLTRNMPHAEAASYLDKPHAGQPALLPSLVPQLGNFSPSCLAIYVAGATRRPGRPGCTLIRLHHTATAWQQPRPAEGHVPGASHRCARRGHLCLYYLPVRRTLGARLLQRGRPQSGAKSYGRAWPAGWLAGGLGRRPSPRCIRCEPACACTKKNHM